MEVETGQALTGQNMVCIIIIIKPGSDLFIYYMHFFLSLSLASLKV